VRFFFQPHEIGQSLWDSSRGRGCRWEAAIDAIVVGALAVRAYPPWGGERQAMDGPSPPPGRSVRAV
jgi:hypothetical protein